MTAKKPPVPKAAPTPGTDTGRADELRGLIHQARAGRAAPRSPREFTDAEAAKLAKADGKAKAGSKAKAASKPKSG